MANTLALKRRIRTAQNVSKTTKAMQMIAASKLKRAQSQATASRPYVETLSDLSNTISKRISKEYNHPYLTATAQSSKKLLVLFGPDRGLSGGLLTNLVRE